jgi:acyl-CoA thioesterase-1
LNEGPSGDRNGSPGLLAGSTAAELQAAESFFPDSNSMTRLAQFSVVALFLVAVAKSETPGKAAIPMDYMQPVVAELKKDWPANRTVQVVCHGHSVPAGYFKTPRVDSLHAYPHVLHQTLAGRFPHAVMNVIVTAIGGENSEQGLARFERDVLPHQPDVLCIDYALNDRRLSLNQARAAWVAMIKKAQAAGVRVILLTPTADLTANMDDPEDPLNQHARQIRGLAAEYHVALVDSLAVFKAEIARGQALESLMAQPNHPNAQGHALVAEELAKWFPSADQ